MAWWNSVAGCFVLIAAQFILLQNKRKHRIWLLLPFIAWIGFIQTKHAMQFDQLEQTILKTEADFSVLLQGEVQWIEKTASSWKVELTKIIVKERSESDSYGNCIVYMEEEPDLQIGNRIQIQGEMELFEQASNPGMYDQRAYYRAQNIRYYVWAKQWEIVNARINFIPNQIYQFRCQLAKILEMVAKQEDVGIMQAVALGEKSELDAELKELYQEYGIAHILAVSGLHISCVGMLLYQLLRRITGSLKISGWISAVFVIGYIILTGSNVSAIRAGVMFILSLIAKQKGKVYDMPSSLSTAVIIILLQYPLQLFQVGFLLSVTTVSGIAIVAPAIYEGEVHSKWWKGLVISCSIQYSSLPVLLWSFFSYPLYSMLLNALVLPFTSVLLFSAGVGSMLGLYWISAAVFLIGSGHFVLLYYRVLCEMFARIPGSVQMIGRASWWQILIYLTIFLSSVCFLEKKADKRRKNGYGIIKPEKRVNSRKEIAAGMELIFLLVAGLFLLKPIHSNELNITVLDVGQGDCSFISFPDGTTMLIDGGSTTENKVGTYRIKPFLYSQGVRELDYVVLTHPDSDHINGVLELLEHDSIEIKSLLLPNVDGIEQSYASILPLCETVIWMEKGMKWETEDVRLRCLHPAQGFLSEDSNDCSIVLQLQYGKFSMLFMGDLGAEQEQRLTDLQDTTILKAGHHGSKNSTSQQFLEKITPDHVILSYGENNSYGHPHKETMERLEKQNCSIWHTPKQGAIQIRVRPNNYYIYGYKNIK